LFTTAAGFRSGNEPVILFVSATYFKEDEPEHLLQRLKASGLTTDCIVLCRETADESMSDRERSKLVMFANLLGLENPAKSR
jgi:hypothetical protein